MSIQKKDAQGNAAQPPAQTVSPPPHTSSSPKKKKPKKTGPRSKAPMVVCELLDSKKKPTGKLIVIFQKSKANSNCFNVIALPKDNEESWKSTGRSDTQTKCVPRMIQNVHKNRMNMLSVPIKMGEDMFNKDGYTQRLKERYVKFCQQQAAKQAEEETDAHSSGDELGASDEESEHLSEDIESSGSEFSGNESGSDSDDESGESEEEVPPTNRKRKVASSETTAEAKKPKKSKRVIDDDDSSNENDEDVDIMNNSDDEPLRTQAVRKKVEQDKKTEKANNSDDEPIQRKKLDKPPVEMKKKKTRKKVAAITEESLLMAMKAKVDPHNLSNDSMAEFNGEAEKQFGLLQAQHDAHIAKVIKKMGAEFKKKNAELENKVSKMRDTLQTYLANRKNTIKKKAAALLAIMPKMSEQQAMKMLESFA